LAVFLEKEIILRTKLETEYGLKDEKKTGDIEVGETSTLGEKRGSELPVPTPGSEAKAI
jgi:hypothetical protein